MRKLLLFVLFGIFLIALQAETLGETSFEIKAFKVNSSATSPELVITDSMADSLEQIKGNTDEIRITDHLQNFLGNTASGISDFAEQIVFSYRCAWNKPGMYAITFKITPFTGAVNSEYCIPARFELSNFNYIFSETSTSHSEDEIFEIVTTGSDVERSIASANQPADFSVSWNVKNNNQSSISCPQWIARGAVAMTLDNTAYNEAPIDEYKSHVTVTLIAN